MTTPLKKVACLLILLGGSQATESAHAKEIDFNRDIRSILSDKCFHCHDPDADNQKSDYRLDSEEAAFAELDGYFGIVPGNLKESELH